MIFYSFDSLGTLADIGHVPAGLVINNFGATENSAGMFMYAPWGSCLRGLIARPGSHRRRGHDLLAAYLGGDAADRVSAGQVQRGAVSRHSELQRR